MNSTKNIFLLFFLILICKSFVLSQESFAAKVTGIPSGDTVTLLTKDKRQMMIRINGIDAPEKEQDFESNARLALFGLVLDQNVNVSGVREDCLKRLTATVTFKGTDLSLWAVKSGYAWADSSCQADEALVREESSAREKKVGLWQNPNPVRPAEFRQPEQAQAETNQSSGRRIFAGLAPTPPPIKTASGREIYIGMSLKEFVDICGEKGEKSKTYTSGSGQSYSLDFPATKQNKDSGCYGNFSFTNVAENGIFKLYSMYQ